MPVSSGELAPLRSLPASLAFLLALSGCATAPELDPSYRLASASGGLVAGSVTYRGLYSHYRVHYRRAGTHAEAVFTNDSNNFPLGPPKGDFDSAEFVGVVFAIPLAAGDYELIGWTVGSGVTTVYATTPFLIPFTVEPGKLLYLGDFHFKMTCSFGLAVKGSTLTHRDAIDRDMPIFRAKFPNVADAPVSRSAAPAAPIENLGGAQSISVTRTPLGFGQWNTKTGQCE